MKMPAAIIIASGLLFVCAIPAGAGLQDGLLLYYSFDVNGGSTVADDSGRGHPGTVYGATYTPAGAIGGAYRFDGIDDRILGGSLGYVPTGSICFWMYADAVQDWRNPFSTDYASWDDCIRFEENTDGKFCWGGLGLSTGVGSPWFTYSLQTGRWYHVAMTWDGLVTRGYFDGSLACSMTYPDPNSPVHPNIPNNAGYWRQISLNFRNIAVGNGYAATPDRFWKGLVDEVRIYNRALAAQEIGQLLTPDTNDLILYYPFDSDEGAVVTDQSGHGNHGAVSGALFSSQGVLGGAYSFDGTDLIAAGNVADLSGSLAQITVCAWIKAPPVAGGQWDMIVAKQQVPVPYRGWMLSLDPASRPGSQLIATHPELVYAGGMAPICDGQWHFLCATFETTPTLLKTLLYVDGQLVGHDERAAVHGATGASSPLTVGSRAPDSAQGYTGFIDEVRIYRRLLTAGEIRGLYDSVVPSPEDQLYIATVGFSNDPEGDQDVTEYFADETLYVTLRDVNVDPANPKFTARLMLHQPGLKGPRSTVSITKDMQMQPDGSFTAAIPLAKFHAGQVRVAILADNRGPGYWLQRVSMITIMPEP